MTKRNKAINCPAGFIQFAQGNSIDYFYAKERNEIRTDFSP